MQYCWNQMDTWEVRKIWVVGGEFLDCVVPLGYSVKWCIEIGRLPPCFILLWKNVNIYCWMVPFESSKFYGVIGLCSCLKISKYNKRWAYIQEQNGGKQELFHIRHYKLYSSYGNLWVSINNRIYWLTTLINFEWHKLEQKWVIIILIQVRWRFSLRRRVFWSN